MKESLSSSRYISRESISPLGKGIILFLGIVICLAFVFMGAPYIGFFLAMIIGTAALLKAQPIWFIAWWVATSNLFMIKLDVPALSGIPEVYYSQVLLGIIILSWIIKKAIVQDQNDHENLVWHSSVTRTLMVWLAICFVSSLWSLFDLHRNFFDVAYAYFALIILVCSYLIIAFTSKSYYRLKIILYAWLFADIVQRIVDTFLIIQNYGFKFSYGHLDPVILHNDKGWFAAAGFGGGGMLFVLAAATIFKDRKQRMVAIGLTFFYLLTGLMRGSRSGLISGIFIIIFVLFFRRRFVFLFIFILVFLAGAALFEQQFIYNYNLNQPLSQAIGTRMALWTDSLSVIQEHPIMGAGIGSYDAFKKATIVSGRKTYSGEKYYFESSSAHNPLFQMAAESGIPSMIIFVVFLGLSAWQSWRLYRSSNISLFRILGLGCLIWIGSGVILGFGGDMILVYTGQVRFRWAITIAEFFIFLGLTMAAKSIQQQKIK